MLLHKSATAYGFHSIRRKMIIKYKTINIIKVDTVLLKQSFIQIYIYRYINIPFSIKIFARVDIKLEHENYV